MSHRRTVVKKCPRCRKLYHLGYNGIVGMCDTCAGVRRDVNDFAWYVGEEVQTRYSIETGVEYTITRSEAMTNGDDTP